MPAPHIGRFASLCAPRHRLLASPRLRGLQPPDPRGLRPPLPSQRLPCFSLSGKEMRPFKALFNEHAPTPLRTRIKRLKVAFKSTREVFLCVVDCLNSFAPVPAPGQTCLRKPQERSEAKRRGYSASPSLSQLSAAIGVKVPRGPTRCCWHRSGGRFRKREKSYAKRVPRLAPSGTE